MSSAWQSHHSPAFQQPNISHRVQALVREARCYPPEREPRIVRDVQDCCRHFQGLQPRLENYLTESQRPVRLLVLDGVIPITYRGVRYQIPVMIYCRPHYPNDAPIPYVRPTSTMVLRDRHSNVDSNGRVYLQHYLSIWDPNQFTLYGLVLSMIRVFSLEPPVTSRPTPRPPPSDEQERRKLISTLSKRISDRLNDSNNDAVVELAQLLQRREVATKNKEKASEEARMSETELESVKSTAQHLSSRKSELETWVGDVVNSQESEEVSVDDILHYKDATLHQIAKSMAQDHAYNDTLDQVDEAFVKGVIDHDTYIKDVRKLGREQFFPRALRKKLEAAAARNPREPTANSSSANNIEA